MSLATCVDNKPWVCEVHYVYDDELNFYFRSKTSRRHSQEIDQNSHVAGNIIEQYLREMKSRGVYFEWDARVLECDELQDIGWLFEYRFGLNTDEIITDAQQQNGHKFYQIRVSGFTLFDKRESELGTKYKLEWNK